ncbi:hypothetical protein B0F90DRAFT_1677822 [Multifurca ochricompacta]|uniref:Defect at low temperature protein 1 n=1 Tax=Multifurca ochricompacta TaxID=376703 RepID=A0AAD4MD07_9AGAM|nr:hypothetical protein B0F90DRAFT_1677822 [Multifurca ochricompacta]
MSRRLRKLSTGVLNIFAWLVFVFTVGVSLVGFLSQAVRTSSRRSFKNNIDVLIIGVAYIVVFLMSLAFCLKRRISMFRKLQRLSRGRSALWRGDIPKHVHEFVVQEYSRACLISFESLPKDAHQEGWGKPGTQWDGICFRRFLLDTIPDLDAQARLLIPSLPPLRPNDRMSHHYRFIASLMPTDEDGLSPLHYYDSAIQLARQADREPTEREFEVGVAAADEIKRILLETRQEMLEGSTPDLNKLPLVL